MPTSTLAVHGAVAGTRLVNTGQDCTAATRAIVPPPLRQISSRAWPNRWASWSLWAIRRTRHRPRAADHDGAPQQGRGMVDRALAGAQSGQSPAARRICPASFYLPRCWPTSPRIRGLPRRDLRPGADGAAPRRRRRRRCARPTTPTTGWPASAWTRDVPRSAGRHGRSRPAALWINDHPDHQRDAPHGGVGASGFGKDMSDYSFESISPSTYVIGDITVSSKPGTEQFSRCAEPGAGPPW